MAYRIEYDGGNQKYEIIMPRQESFLWMISAALMLFILLTAFFWQEGWEVLRDMLIPGDDTVTLNALSGLMGNLHGGMELGEAIRAFCEEVLNGAANPY